MILGKHEKYKHWSLIMKILLAGLFLIGSLFVYAESDCISQGGGAPEVCNFLTEEPSKHEEALSYVRERTEKVTDSNFLQSCRVLKERLYQIKKKATTAESYNYMDHAEADSIRLASIGLIYLIERVGEIPEMCDSSIERSIDNIEATYFKLLNE